MMTCIEKLEVLQPLLDHWSARRDPPSWEQAALVEAHTQMAALRVQIILS
jgi:hypothetical protein